MLVPPPLHDTDGCLQETHTALSTTACTDVNLTQCIHVAGGKMLDIAKMVAAKLCVPMVLLPSLASTDAPCLAVSIVYNDEGE
jgi:glycerol dehydrogenase